MANRSRIETPHIRIHYTDGRTITVQTDNPDMVFYDIERARRNWPAGQDAPMLWINYLAFAKLRRTGEIDKRATFEEWLLTTEAIENLSSSGEPDDAVATVGPTQPAPESG